MSKYFKLGNSFTFDLSKVYFARLYRNKKEMRTLELCFTKDCPYDTWKFVEDGEINIDLKEAFEKISDILTTEDGILK